MTPRPAVVTVVALAALGGLYALSGLYFVGPDERAVLTRFGAVAAQDAGPGVRWHAPWPFAAASVARVTVTDSASASARGATSARGARRSCELLTGDRCLLECEVLVDYVVTSPQDGVRSSGDLDALVRRTAEASVSAAVARATLSDVLGRSDALCGEAASVAQAALDARRAGVDVVSVRLSGVRLPGAAGEAHERAIAASESTAAVLESADAYRGRVVPLARGESAALIAAAQSYAVRAAATASTEAARFTALLAEYRAAPGEVRERLRRAAVADLLTSARLEVVDSAGAATGDTVMSGDRSPSAEGERRTP